MHLIREEPLEEKVDVAILGRKGRKSTKPPIRALADFSKHTVMAFTRGYASVPNKFAFRDGTKGNAKNVEMRLVLGMDVEIALVLKDGEMDTM